MSGEVKVSPEPKNQAPRARKRSYEAASPSRNGSGPDGWFGTVRSADSELFNEARTIRDKSRWLVRNNAHAAKAVAALASNIVGEGIVPRPVTGSKKRDKKVWDAFHRWALRCDHGGQLDFYGFQTLLCREFIEGGDVLVRKRLRKKADRPGDIPLELQLLEADFLDPMRNGPLREGAMSVQGVEIDLTTSKRTAYWLFPFHPGNMPYFVPGQPMMSVPVPADEVLHVYEQQRTQTRGAPWGTPAIEKLRLLDDYELAEVVRKKVEACVVGIVSGAEDDSEDGIGVRDADDNEVERFEPGMILRAHGAKSVTFNTPASTGGYGDFHGVSLMTIAAGYRVPYELISGDLSNVNFSSMRGGLIEFRRLISAVQWQILIQLALQPIWEWWCEIAFLAGEIDEPYIPVEWSPPKFAWVDPMADIQSASLEVRNGFRSPQDVIAETGRNPDDVLDEIEAFNEATDAKGIVLDSDPRKTNAKGAQQPIPKSDDRDDDGELSRPNRIAANGRKTGRAAPVRTGCSVPQRELRRRRTHDRYRVDDWSERSPLRLVGRNRVR